MRCNSDGNYAHIMKSNSALTRLFYMVYAMMMAVAGIFYFVDNMRASRLYRFYQPMFFVFDLCLLVLFYSLISKRSENRKDRVLILVSVILLGLLMRRIAYYWFQTQQTIDFKHPLTFYRYFKEHGPYTTELPWESRTWLELYYARFPAWYSYFRVVKFVYDLFGENVENLIRMNYLLMVGTTLLIYFAIRDKKVALMSSALFSFNPTLISYSCNTAADHFSIFFFTLAAFFWGRLEEQRTENWQKNRKLLAFSLAMMLSCVCINFFKPLSILFLLTFICYELLSHMMPAIKNKTSWKVFWKNTLSFELAFVVIFVALIMGGNGFLRQSIRNTLKIEPIDSTGWYLYCAYGITEDGHFGNDASQVFSELMDKYNNNLVLATEEMNQISWEQFKRNSPYILWFIRQKFGTLFSREYNTLYYANTSASEEWSQKIEDIAFYPIMAQMATYLRIIYLLTAGMAVVEIFRRRVNSQVQQMMIIIFGYLMVLIVGAPMSRYKCLVIPMWCIAGGYAVSVFAEIADSSWTSLMRKRFSSKKQKGQADAIQVKSDVETATLEPPEVKANEP